MENLDSSFPFQHVPKDEIIKTNKMLNLKKEVYSTDIPIKLIKIFSGFFSDYICINLDKCIRDEENVEDFKTEEVRPQYKRDGRKEKSNYRPVSIL